MLDYLKKNKYWQHVQQYVQNNPASVLHRLDGLLFDNLICVCAIIDH